MNSSVFLQTFPLCIMHCSLFIAKRSAFRVPFDLHVLGTPPAFILSQDQTLMLSFSCMTYGLRRLCVTQSAFPSLLSEFSFKNCLMGFVSSFWSNFFPIHFSTLARFAPHTPRSDSKCYPIICLLRCQLFFYYIFISFASVLNVSVDALLRLLYIRL